MEYAEYAKICLRHSKVNKLFAVLIESYDMD